MPGTGLTFGDLLRSKTPLMSGPHGQGILQGETDNKQANKKSWYA